MPIRALCLALIVSTTLCACGLRGPLYLPDDTQAAESEPAQGSGKSRRPAPAPQAQKRDRDGGSAAPAQSTAPLDPDRPADVPAVPAGN